MEPLCGGCPQSLLAAGFGPDGPMGEAELSGLPLPDGVYDGRVPMKATKGGLAATAAASG